MIQQYKQGTAQHIYELLEEIHPTEYRTYIDTGVNVTTDISVEVKYKCPVTMSNIHPHIFGVNRGFPDAALMSIDYEDTPKYLQVKMAGYTQGWNYVSSISPDQNEHTVFLSASEFKYDGVTMYTTTPSTYSSSYPLLIAQVNLDTPSTSQNGQGYFNYYYFKIWDGNTLVRDYVPAKRLSDNAIGMYDNVNDTFSVSDGDKQFVGTSKSTPEYIDELTDNTVYVNNIMFNGNHINRIYLNGNIYWGNNPSAAPTPPPIPTVGNTISGTASVTSQTVSNAIKVNGTTYSVNVDANGEWTLQLSSPVNSLSQVIQNNLITSIDLRDVEYDTYCDLSNAFCINKAYNLTDIWFDFRTAPNTNFMSTGALLSEPRNVAVHGLGTLQWSGRLNQTSAWTSDPTAQNCFSLREMFWANIIGTLDIRGIDTSHIDDIGWSVSDYTTVSLNSSVGYFYRALYSSTGSSQRLDTLIIGNLKIISNSTQSQVIDIPTVKTLYVTTTDTSCLGNSSFDYVALMSGLEHIYVPVGSLNDFVNDSAWSNYTSIISEQDAPDPMLI